MSEERRGPGRPKGSGGPKPSLETLDAIEDLVDSPHYFEAEMKEFFARGQMAQLQKWFIAAGNRDLATRIANVMLLRFSQALLTVMPKQWPSE